jgi:YD repeat-containing protein
MPFPPGPGPASPTACATCNSGCGLGAIDTSGSGPTAMSQNGIDPSSGNVSGSVTTANPGQSSGISIGFTPSNQGGSGSPMGGNAVPSWAYLSRTSSSCSCSSGSSFSAGPLADCVVVLTACSLQVTFEKSCSTHLYKARDGMDSAFTMTHSGSQFTVSVKTTTGIQTLTFWDFDQTSYPTGILSSYSNADGSLVTQVTSYPAGVWGIGSVNRAETGSGDYAQSDNTYNMDGTLAQTITSSSVDGDLTKVDYDYASGALSGYTSSEWDGSAWGVVEQAFYRNYTVSDPDGIPGLVKYAVGPAAFAAMVADGFTPSTATDAQLAVYADAYYEYETNTLNAWYRGVTKVVTQNSGGAGTASTTYARRPNPYNPLPSGRNVWATKTIITNASGVDEILYTNTFGQTMLRVVQGIQPSASSGSSSSSSSSSSARGVWYEFYRYDESTGQVTLQADSAAVKGYDDTFDDLLNFSGSSYQYLQNSSGLLTLFTYGTGTTATPFVLGDVAGMLKTVQIKKGQTATAITLRSLLYTARTTVSPAFYSVGQETVYPDDTTTATTIVTSYAYTYYSGTNEVQQKTTTLPAISSGQHGSGTSATRKEYYDTFGRLTWQMDERGFITYFRTDARTGWLLKRVDDVNTSGFSPTPPSGWTTPGGGGLNLATDYEYDKFGRQTQVLGPAHAVELSGTSTSVRAASWSVYTPSDSIDEAWSGRGYHVVSGGSDVLIDPVSITRSLKSGQTVESIQSKRTSGSGRLAPGDTFDQADYTRWTFNSYDTNGQQVYSRVYFDIPSSGVGSPGTNYNETYLGYDPDTRLQLRSKGPGGTVTRSLYDQILRPSSSYVGLTDTPTGGSGWEDWYPGAPGTDLVLVGAQVYDSGLAGGDSNVTSTTAYVNGSTTRVTSYTYDFRNRRVTTTGPQGWFQQVFYDNLDRLTKSEGRNGSVAGTLLGRMETYFDDRGRVYETRNYAVNPTTGAVGIALTGDSYYDDAGNLIQFFAPGGGVGYTKNAYDSLGRLTVGYFGVVTTSEYVLERTTTAYNEVGGVLSVQVDQLNEDTTTYSTFYSATWYDGADRPIAGANYGTNGGSAFTRPPVTPARSDTVLVTGTQYSSTSGDPATTTDPMAVVYRREYDDAGRLTRQVDNYTGGSPGSVADRTTEFTYNADGQRATVTAKMVSSGDDQTTSYAYGTTLSDSDIASSLLLRSVDYPDSVSGSDRITYSYNRQGQVTTKLDQNGSVHSMDYDGLGRMTQDRVTTLGGGVDGRVRRVGVTYDVRMLLSTVTSYDNATVGSGSVLNQVQRDYNDLRQIGHDYQAHSGTVSTSTTPRVNHGYWATPPNTSRLTYLVYPNTRQVALGYSAVATISDKINRVNTFVLPTSGAVQFTYRGLRLIYNCGYNEPGISNTLYGAPLHPGLDRFDRILNWSSFSYGGGLPPGVAALLRVRPQLEPSVALQRRRGGGGDQGGPALRVRCAQ